MILNRTMWINLNFNRIPLPIVIATLLYIFRPSEGRAFASVSTNTTRLSIESNSIQRLLIETTHTGSGGDSGRSLKRVFLSNRTVTCNDGSQAGFYLRKSSGSKKWVVFLEGGWHCYDMKSCRTRWLRLRHLMTSAQWPETKDVGGILSPIPDDNPYWHNANHVLVPYCSSDSWSGTKSEADSRDGWRFMGSLIIRQVMADLIPLGLGRSPGAELILAGSSAGGLGVMLNLDQIRTFLHKEKNIKVAVRGISDSGWFLDREPYTPGAVAASEAVRQGWKMWEGALPEACVKHHSVEPWRCYFGHRLYPTLKSPLFVFQWLFDEAQMRADSVGAPVTPQQWDYIHDMGGALRASLDNVTAVFAPSCIGHSVLTKRDWLNIKIEDISLSQALRCWEKSTGRKRDKLRRSSGLRNGGENKRKRHNQREKNHNKKEHNKKNQDKPEKKLTKEERQQRRRHNEQKRLQKRLRSNQNALNDNKSGLSGENRTHTDRSHHRRRKNQTNVQNINNNNNNNNNRNNHQKRRRQGDQAKQHQHHHHHHHNHQQDQDPSLHELQQDVPDNTKNDNGFPDSISLSSSSIAPSTSSSHHNTEPKKCSLRLLEKCSWPQCNYSCPTLTNPLTGEEMRFLELLASFGLDIKAVAQALGVDMQTLNNMDHTELVNLLTQQVS